MARVPVKLTRGEIVLPPSVARQYRQRLEEMNAMGLQARAAGGVVAYRQLGGVTPQTQPEQPAGTQQFLGQTVPTGAIGNLGQSLVALGQRDFAGASAALAQPTGAPDDETEEALLAKMERLLRQANPQFAKAAVQPVVPIQGSNRGGLIAYRQEGGDVPVETEVPVTDPVTPLLPPVANVGGGDAVDQFVSAAGQNDPLAMVKIQKENSLNIPLEFDSLSETTKEIRNLIFTYKLYEEGTISKEDWETYIDTVWLKKKAAKTYNKFAPGDYAGANGKLLKFVSEGPDAGSFFDPSLGTAVRESTHPEYFDENHPRKITADEDDAITKYQEITAGNAADFGKALSDQSNASYTMNSLASQAVAIMEAYPQVAGVFNIEALDTDPVKMGKSIALFLSEGITTPWGTIGVDLKKLIDNIRLDENEKAQLSKLEGIFADLKVKARAELAGQGTVTDAEADAVARKFGDIDSGASATIASLKLIMWRNDLTTEQLKKWFDFEQTATSKRAVPSVPQFLSQIWGPYLKAETEKLDVVALGAVEVQTYEGATGLEDTVTVEFTDQEIQGIKDAIKAKASPEQFSVGPLNLALYRIHKTKLPRRLVEALEKGEAKKKTETSGGYVFGIWKGVTTNWYYVGIPPQAKNEGGLIDAMPGNNTTDSPRNGLIAGSDDVGVDPFDKDVDPEVQELVIEWADKLGLDITDHIGLVLETAIVEWRDLPKKAQDKLGSLEDYIRYALEEEDIPTGDATDTRSLAKFKARGGLIAR